MSANYLLLFRFVLLETLLLHWQNARGAVETVGRVPAVLIVYGLGALTLFFLERKRLVKTIWRQWSFVLDIGAASLVLFLMKEVATDFYIAFFLVILASSVLQKPSFSFALAGLSCLIYGYLAWPGVEGIFSPEFLLRLALLSVMSLFSAFAADTTRQTEERFRSKLAWAQRLSMVGRAMTSVLHDVKTPLSTIVLNAELARDLLKKGKKADEQLDLIEAEADRAVTMLKEFLEYSKPKEIERAPLRLAVPLKRVIETMRIRLEEKEVRLETRLDEELRITGSERHLIQAFGNVVMNAIEAMPLGGRLSVSLVRAREDARVRIEDTGTGITPETLKSIFEPFHTTRGLEGVGLGLSIVQWIVEKHDGKVSVESPGRGKGTAVTLDFPALTG